MKFSTTPVKPLHLPLLRLLAASVPPRLRGQRPQFLFPRTPTLRPPLSGPAAPRPPTLGPRPPQTSPLH